MRNDLFLVIGLIVAALSIPSLVSAFSESRPPRSAAIMMLIAGGLIAIAVTQKPGGYAMDDIPDAFGRVISHYVR